MTTCEILLKAADLIERDGWCQGADLKQVDGKPARCAERAIEEFLTSRRKFWEVMRALRNHVTVNTVWEWNDAPGRTKEEVIAGLRGAAAQCEEG